MSYIEKTAYHLGRRDEVPNQELAKELAMKDNVEGLNEMASYLNDKNKSLASDCLKVLYEASYIKPELIVPYFDQLIELLHSKNNRMVWGGAMIGIASVAKVEPDQVYKHIALIRNKIETGSLITNIHGVYAMINMAGGDAKIYDAIYEELVDILKKTRPVDVAKRAEALAAIVRQEDKAAFIALLESLKERVSKAGGAKRIEKVIKNC